MDFFCTEECTVDACFYPTLIFCSGTYYTDLNLKGKHIMFNFTQSYHLNISNLLLSSYGWFFKLIDFYPMIHFECTPAFKRRSFFSQQYCIHTRDSSVLLQGADKPFLVHSSFHTSGICVILYANYCLYQLCEFFFFCALLQNFL